MLTYDQKLRAIRAVLRLKQSEMCKKFDVSEDRYYVWEKNKCEPTLKNKVKIDLMFNEIVLQGVVPDSFANFEAKIDKLIAELQYFKNTKKEQHELST